MKFGDEEWLRILDENYSFPCKIAFNLIKERSGSVSIVSTLIKTKSKIENVKFDQAYSATWTSEGSAVLSVKEIKNATDYLKEAERLRYIWGFALSKEVKGDDLND